MASILMGVICGFLFTTMSIWCIWLGFNLGKKQISEEVKEKPEISEEQKRMAEGFNNLLNYANRHKRSE